MSSPPRLSTTSVLLHPYLGAIQQSVFLFATHRQFSADAEKAQPLETDDIMDIRCNFQCPCKLTDSFHFHYFKRHSNSHFFPQSHWEMNLRPQTRSTPFKIISIWTCPLCPSWIPRGNGVLFLFQSFLSPSWLRSFFTGSFFCIFNFFYSTGVSLTAY